MSSGIYSIEILPVKAVYVGSSVNIGNRLRSHKANLYPRDYLPRADGSHIARDDNRGYWGHSRFGKYMELIHDKGMKVSFKTIEEINNHNLFLDRELHHSVKYYEDGWQLINAVYISHPVGFNYQGAIGLDPHQMKVITRMARMMQDGVVDSYKLDGYLTKKVKEGTREQRVSDLIRRGVITEKMIEEAMTKSAIEKND